MFISSGATKPAFAILAVVFGFVVHGAQAAASCGDYLYTVHSRPMSHPEAKPGTQAEQHEAADLAWPVDRPTAPCSGPGCDRNNGAEWPPLIPTIGSASPISDAMLNSAACLAASNGPFSVPHETATSRRGFPHSLKKPPRSLRG